MAKILFIVPPFSLAERYGKLGQVGTLYPPLGLAYLGAVARQLGHEVRISDGLVLRCSLADIEQELKTFAPEVIGFQTFFSNIERALTLAAFAKKVRPTAKIIMGGPEASSFPEKFITRDEVDFVIKGEGEIALAEFLNEFTGAKNWAKVKSLVWKQDGQVRQNDQALLIKNLDEIPLPDLSLLPMNKYSAAADKRGRRVMHLMTSRGCPFHCSFCATGATFGKTYRYQSTARVLREIDILTSQYQADEIQFFDDIFTLNRERVIALCRALIERKSSLQWTCETRVDTVDLELLKIMKQAGCYRVAFGVESGVERLLKLINKGITLAKVEQAFKWCREAGLETFGLFMLALPSETREESFQTINFAIKIKPDFVQFALTAPFPGTELFDLSLRHGRIVNTNYDKYTSWEVVYVPSGRTEQEVAETFKTAYRKFYLRPAFMFKKLKSFAGYPVGTIFRLAKAALRVAQ